MLDNLRSHGDILEMKIQQLNKQTDQEVPSNETNVNKGNSIKSHGFPYFSTFHNIFKKEIELMNSLSVFFCSRNKNIFKD